MRIAGRFGILAVAATTSVAIGQEMTVQNDSLVDFGSAFVCPCFAENEQAAAWLTSPCDGSIVAVQIFWKSQFGGQPQSLESKITVFQAGSFPTPGPEMNNEPPFAIPIVLEGPVLTDGVINEFRFLDEQSTVAIDGAVTTGQEFVVSLQFLNANENMLTAASVTYDTDGCQANKNAVFALGAGWIDLCAAGGSGDWVIRAVVDCEQGATGACCLTDGSCQVISANDCSLAGGDFLGDGSSCPPACPGACCFDDSSCQNQLTEEVCQLQDGIFQGPGSTCDDPCDVDGACCFTSSGTCLDFSEEDCMAARGVFNGVGSSCQDTVCTGACCFEPEGCLDFSTDDCTVAGGNYEGVGTTCATFICNPSGACCLPDGLCQDDVGEDDCIAGGGVFQGDGSLCSGVTCPQPDGACCLSNGNCLDLSAVDCNQIPGTEWAGPNTACNDVPDPCSGKDCLGDTNGDGVVDVQDLTNVILDWGSSGVENNGDVTGDDTVDVSDLTAIILNWGTC